MSHQIKILSLVKCKSTCNGITLYIKERKVVSNIICGLGTIMNIISFNSHSGIWWKLNLREPKELTQVLSIKKWKDQDLSPTPSSNNTQHVLATIPYGFSPMLIYFHLLLLHYEFLINNDFFNIATTQFSYPTKLTIIHNKALVVSIFF